MAWRGAPSFGVIASVCAIEAAEAVELRAVRVRERRIVVEGARQRVRGVGIVGVGALEAGQLDVVLVLHAVVEVPLERGRELVQEEAAARTMCDSG